MVLTKMPRDIMSNEPPAYVREMFPYSDFECTGGPTDVLEATGTTKEVNNPYSPTCYKISYGIHSGGDM